MRRSEMRSEMPLDINMHASTHKCTVRSMHECMHARMHARTHARKPARTHARTHPRTQACACAHALTSSSSHARHVHARAGRAISQSDEGPVPAAPHSPSCSLCIGMLHVLQVVGTIAVAAWRQARLQPLLLFLTAWGSFYGVSAKFQSMREGNEKQNNKNK